ncbi:Ase1p Ecym_5475 [Eremothecium cymbalariae DBVPG|uniref:Uncharacterized protein n=1 Tax=Eremothecium cymbalariae (strain CBS 270.75 / DBVPG 7215 / KCTC 17166 / NRRL Y-17582) TaxID=931890 RepID=I6NDS9_ERECY|nr:hypothetical protein Ecym_5475 [Eremothecium cymbalariae DBVPG\
MQRLININDPQNGQHSESLSSPEGVRSFQSTVNNSLTRNTARSPVTEEISDTVEKAAAELLRLTPVNIGNLSSPMREVFIGEEGLAPMNNISNSTLQHYIANPEVYRENFNLISKQLENLLENLNVIYKEIGYSNNEISSREKMIFSKLSNSISSFFDQANEEKARLYRENDLCQELLRRILEVINDPRGTKSIPDLYTRNCIMGMESQSPNKKPVSLLNKRRVLTNAKLFVMKTYTPKLLCYLDSSIRLRSLIDSMPDYEPESNLQLVRTIPPVDTCQFFKGYFMNHANDIESNYQFVLENKKLLLYSVNFSDVTEDMIKNFNELSKMYQNERCTRLTKIRKMSQELSNLLQALGVEIRDLDSDLKDMLTVYTRDEKDEVTRDISFSVMAALKKVIDDYQLIRKTRETEKQNLIAKCEQLWEKLKISPCYVDSFKTEHSTLSMSDIGSFSKEFERLESMKKKLIKNLINDSWKRIVELWDIMEFHESERYSFTSLFENMKSTSTLLEDDEKVLDLCEGHIKTLEKKYAVVKPILVLVDEFKSLQRDRVQLEESSRDSSRLLSRSSHKILLKEEKARKKITRYFPGVIYELKSKLDAYSNEFNEEFMVDGVKFVDILDSEQEQLLNKYPRMRFTHNGRKSFVRCNSLPSTYSVQKKVSRSQTSTVTVRNVTDKTPIRKTENTSSARSKPNSDLQPQINKSAPCSTVNNRSIRGTHIASPQKRVRYIPSNVMIKSSPTRIPVLSSTNSNMALLSPVNKKQNKTTKLTQLSVLSSNKLNQRSNIPILSSHINTFPLIPADKENSYSLESPANITKKLRQQLLSSPTRNGDHPVNDAIKSEDTRTSTTVEDIKASHIAEDESSMMEDRNFAEWKQSQLAKLNENSVTKTNNITARINQENDLF